MTTTLDEIGPKDIRYFGCWGEPGHYLYDCEHRMIVRQEAAIWRSRNLDAGYCPNAAVDSFWIAHGPQIEGEALLHHVDGWTVLAFWDRSGDRRSGSNSAFLMRGEHTFEDVVNMSKFYFPEIWKRFTFEVRLKK